ncbi:MAG TPA: GspH/FimT family pseudopilin [Rhizobacter sp.]|nr:GspH/FimT family pseudopilin [Rhizobacter sp.]
MPTGHTKQKSSRGFTLIEAMVTVAVAGILASAAAPSFRGLIDTRRIDGAATQLAADLHFARSEAVSRNQPVRISIHHDAVGSSCYVVHTGNADQCLCSDTAPAQCTGDAEQIKTVLLPATGRVSLQANVSSLLFDPLHGTSTPTGTLRLVGADGRAIHHVVNVMGRVRSCSPQAAVSGYRVC